MIGSYVWAMALKISDVGSQNTVDFATYKKFCVLKCEELLLCRCSLFSEVTFKSLLAEMAFMAKGV